MTELGTAIAEQVILNYGRSEFLTRLSDPFWFQAYGAVMGMDWHSSGITTSVIGALQRGLIRVSQILALRSAVAAGDIPPGLQMNFAHFLRRPDSTESQWRVRAA
jgi:hypothetical protein